MWKWLAGQILRYRIPLLVLLALLTGVMGYYGIRVEVQHEFVNVIPPEDPDYQTYMKFKGIFGDDGNAVVIGLRSDDFYTPARLNGLKDLGERLRKNPDVTGVMNMAEARVLVSNDSLERFELKPVLAGHVANQAAADSIRRLMAQQVFYSDLLFSPDRKVMLMAVSLSRRGTQTRARTAIVNEIIAQTNKYAEQNGMQAYFAGLPTVRAYVATRVPKELTIFSLLALLLTAIALFVFYRSLYAVIFPLLLLAVCAVFTFGIVALLGYKVTLLSALLPPIIIILGIPPSIYMLSEYHEEYQKTGDKEKALRIMFQKLGLVTLMINANTAFGFLTLYLTDVVILQEFGLVAFIATMTTYLITIVMIPGVFSLLPPPNDKHLRHLDSRFMRRLVEGVDSIVTHRKRWIYVITVTMLVVSAFGMMRLRSVFYVVDDLPQRDKIRTDMRMMESQFKGVVPFEVFIDTKRPNGLRRLATLRKIDSLQLKLASYPEISRTVSMVDALKWSRQALFGGAASQYLLPTTDEYPALVRYNKKSSGNKSANPLNVLVDSTYRYARISAYMQDVGSSELPKLIKRVEADVDTLFGPVSDPPKKSRPAVEVTGVSRVYLHANEYLIKNLVWSLVATFLLIGLQMWALFGSLRIMFISLLVNLIPLGMTAGMMGYFGIPLKPGSALIYELAFGIAIDNSIHYLAMYRLFRKGGKGVLASVTATNLSTGVAIIYTSTILFAGFFIFVLSSFSNTQFMGSLTSITLLSATFSNLFLLPALLRDFDTEKQVPKAALIDEG
jgi:uncharacterized protein